MAEPEPEKVSEEDEAGTEWPITRPEYAEIDALHLKDDHVRLSLRFAKLAAVPSERRARAGRRAAADPGRRRAERRDAVAPRAHLLRPGRERRGGRRQAGALSPEPVSSCCPACSPAGSRSSAALGAGRRRTRRSSSTRRTRTVTSGWRCPWARRAGCSARRRRSSSRSASRRRRTRRWRSCRTTPRRTSCWGSGASASATSAVRPHPPRNLQQPALPRAQQPCQLCLPRSGRPWPSAIVFSS